MNKAAENRRGVATLKHAKPELGCVSARCRVGQHSYCYVLKCDYGCHAKEAGGSRKIKGTN